jgi:hypothetical protein
MRDFYAIMRIAACGVFVDQLHEGNESFFFPFFFS